MITGLDPQHYFMRISDPATKALTVVFSARGAKAGAFSMFKTMERAGANVLHVTPADATWYQTGLPGLGDDLPTAFSALAERVTAYARDNGYDQLWVIGDSMGAYAALVFGSMIKGLPTKMLALGAETVLKLPGARSSEKRFPVTHFTDIRELAYPETASATMIFGEYDEVDIFCALSMRDRPQFRLYSHAWSPHSVAPELHADMGLAEFVKNAFRGNYFFPGRGHLASALRAADVEPLVHKRPGTGAYHTAIKRCLRRYPAFRQGWALWAEHFVRLGDPVRAREALRRADIGVRPPKMIAAVRERITALETQPAPKAVSPVA